MKLPPGASRRRPAACNALRSAGCGGPGCLPGRRTCAASTPRGRPGTSAAAPASRPATAGAAPRRRRCPPETRR
ncbi:MAG: hypothetical protein KJ054_12980 [Gammaproteobacteria bacterium]|nr:hypothetical protein [Gammaproteobacteria bacterium]